MKHLKPILYGSPVVRDGGPQGFLTGMSVHDQDPSVPKIILNMRPDHNGKLVKRPGYTLFASLPGSHSLWSDGMYLYCVAAGTTMKESVWRIDRKGNKVELGGILGYGDPMSFVKGDSAIYMSTTSWCGVYDGTFRSWGRLYPKYQGEIGESVEEMLTLGVEPPLPMYPIILWSGRIWGCRGSRVYYSEPFALEWWRRTNFFEFNEELTSIASTEAGMYVSSWDHTWFLSGMVPEEMQQSEPFGFGAVPGTLAYPLLKDSPTPVWASPYGIVGGLEGKVVNLTSERVKYERPYSGAAISYETNGMPVYMSSLKSYDFGIGDSVTAEVIRNNSL